MAESKLSFASLFEGDGYVAYLKRLLSFLPGDKYVVVDSGGGTVDLTVHQIRLPEGHLKELYKATGDPPPGWLASPASSHSWFTHFKFLSASQACGQWVAEGPSICFICLQ